MRGRVCASEGDVKKSVIRHCLDLAACAAWVGLWCALGSLCPAALPRSRVCNLLVLHTDLLLEVF